MTVPAALAAAVARAAGAAVTGGARASGGSINEAWALELAGGARAFVKTRADAAPGEYATEAAGLRWLAQAQAVALPGVLAVGEDGRPRFLALEWVDEGRWTPPAKRSSGAGSPPCTPPARPRSARRRPARRRPTGARAPAHRRARLPNDPAADWPSFYAQRRLGRWCAVPRRAAR